MGVGGRLKNFFMSALRKPVSHIVAPAIGLAAVLQLLFTPLPNGDGWVNRLKFGFQKYAISKNPMDLLGSDGVNDITTIIGPQLIANAIPAAITGIGAAITYKIGKWFGL